MNEITSVNNPDIKQISKLISKKNKSDLPIFIVEGIKPLEDMLEQNIEIVQVFTINPQKIIDKIEENKITKVPESILKKLSSTDSAAEIITIAKKFEPKLASIKYFGTIAVLEGIKDPGNLGAIIRSAAAFNIKALILTGDCVDKYNPKVIRSAAGNYFKIPILYFSSINEVKKLFSNHIFVSTDLSDKNKIELSALKKLKNKIVILGSEANGLTKSTVDLCDYNFVLDISKNVESLNLATAASIIFYELSKP